MNRRAFLDLLASAPIAALAPWQRIVPLYGVGQERHWFVDQNLTVFNSSDVALGPNDPEWLAIVQKHGEDAMKRLCDLIELDFEAHGK